MTNIILLQGDFVKAQFLFVTGIAFLCRLKHWTDLGPDWTEEFISFMEKQYVEKITNKTANFHPHFSSHCCDLRLESFQYAFAIIEFTRVQIFRHIWSKLWPLLMHKVLQFNQMGITNC